MEIAQKQPEPKTPAPPTQPTMTTSSLQSPNDPQDLYDGRGGYAPAPELGKEITARPMIAPNFVDIKPSISGRNLSFRWMFTDQRRFSQVKAQGWRIATKTDVANADLSPYLTEGGSKFINGDLVLMCIKRELYLGALKYKHEVAARLSDAAVQKTLSARRAVNDMGETVASVNRQRVAQGKEPVMQVFTPGAADISHLPAAKETGRLGHDGPPDMASGVDIRQQAESGS